MDREACEIINLVNKAMESNAMIYGRPDVYWDDDFLEDCWDDLDLDTLTYRLEEYAITNDGRLNARFTRALEARVPDGSIRVAVGESDSFGPLSAVLHTPKGMFVFG